MFYAYMFYVWKSVDISMIVMGDASDVMEYDRITPGLAVSCATPHERRNHQYRESIYE
jgi:hypothetical protein